MIESIASHSSFPSYGTAGSARSTSSTVTKPSAQQDDAGSRRSTASKLTPEQQRQVQALVERDRKVRAHEQAHISAGANLVRGGASYSYQTGPDDRRYAVGGEVSIDASPGRTPEETISKAERIRAAALAPADPSAQDRGVAAQAGLMEAEARIELSAQRLEKTAEKPPAVSVPSEQDGARSYRAVEQTAWVFSPLGGHLNSFA